MVKISELFGGKALMKLMHYFAENPGEISQSGLLKEMKISKVTLGKCLKKLLREGILTVRSLGKMKLYRLNRENAFVKQYKILDTIAQLLPARIIASRHRSEIFLFGSAARGEDTEKSDIDLLIITEDDQNKIRMELEKEIKTKRKLAFHFFSYLEWSQTGRKDKAFYERIERDKIRVA